MYTDTELIESIIISLDKLEVKGVANMAIVIDSIQKLGALKNGLEAKKKKEGEPCDHHDKPGTDV